MAARPAPRRPRTIDRWAGEWMSQGRGRTATPTPRALLAHGDLVLCYFTETTGPGMARIQGPARRRYSRTTLPNDRAARLRRIVAACPNRAADRRPGRTRVPSDDGGHGVRDASIACGPAGRLRIGPLVGAHPSHP